MIYCIITAISVKACCRIAYLFYPCCYQCFVINMQICWVLIPSCFQRIFFR